VTVSPGWWKKFSVRCLGNEEGSKNIVSKRKGSEVKWRILRETQVCGNAKGMPGRYPVKKAGHSKERGCGKVAEQGTVLAGERSTSDEQWAGRSKGPKRQERLTKSEQPRCTEQGKGHFRKDTTGSQSRRRGSNPRGRGLFFRR